MLHTAACYRRSSLARVPTAAPAAGAATPAPGGPAGRGEQDTPDVLPDAVLADMLDTYAIVQAQRALTIPDEQYGSSRATQEAAGLRRRNTAAPTDSFRTRRLVGPRANPPTTRIRAQLAALREHDDRAATELRRRTRRSTCSNPPAGPVPALRGADRAAQARTARARPPRALQNRTQLDSAETRQLTTLSDGAVRVQLQYGFATAVLAAFGLSLAIATALVVLAPRSPAQAQPRFTKQEADRCQGKLGRITSLPQPRRARRLRRQPRRPRSSPTPR